jgi:hypothetical protein
LSPPCKLEIILTHKHMYEEIFFTLCYNCRYRSPKIGLDLNCRREFRAKKFIPVSI